MKPTELLEVIIWDNEPESGHFLGYLTGFDAGVLSLACTLMEDSCWLLFDGNYLRVTDGAFYVAERQRHFAGVKECDRVVMPAESVCALINWALSNDFSYQTISTSFLNVLNEERKIKIEDLRLIYFASCTNEA